MCVRGRVSLVVRDRYVNVCSELNVCLSVRNVLQTLAEDLVCVTGAEFLRVSMTRCRGQITALSNFRDIDGHVVVFTEAIMRSGHVVCDFVHCGEEDGDGIGHGGQITAISHHGYILVLADHVVCHVTRLRTLAQACDHTGLASNGERRDGV